MKNNLDTPVAKQCRALYTKISYGHTYGLLKTGLWCKIQQKKTKSSNLPESHDFKPCARH